MKNNLPPDPELDALVREINRSARGTEDDAAESGVEPVGRNDWALSGDEAGGHEILRELLARCRRDGATDLILAAGAPPVARIDGDLRPLRAEPMSSTETAVVCAALVPGERRAATASRGALDFSLAPTGLGRLRCNVHRERGSWSAAIRLFPEEPPDLGEINLPDVLGRLADLQHGLVLVTGPTGCGKSTTLAAILKRLLSRRRVHVITIEDPVEYEHPHGDSVVEHIEIGRDALSFNQALRSALRQNPDVLLIGEMRDRESISIAITAAETGHLVLSTLHTGDAPQTVNRILDSYPAEQIDAIRTQLSVSLAAIVSQRLLPRRQGPGRVPAVEVLLASDAVRNLIRKGKIEQLRAQIALEQGSGMISLDQSLAALVQRGLVELREARHRARAPKEFESLLTP